MSRFIVDNSKSLDMDDAVETYEMNFLVDSKDDCFYMVIDSSDNLNLLCDKLNRLVDSEEKLVGLKEFMLRKLEVCEEEYDRLCHFGASTSVVLSDMELLEELIGMLE